MYDIQHCFTCRPSDSTVSEDAGIEPRTVTTTALAVRTSNLARSHPSHFYGLIERQVKVEAVNDLPFWLSQKCAASSVADP
jgi:hypothetical protein